VETHDEQVILQPVRPAAPIRKEDGIWVYRSNQSTTQSIRELIEEGRDERERRILGLEK
jgi:hypothetical protein